ncbi:hypothetical protein NQZ68_019466 [Dissostichus eleginoides]|nr:hypothetical protein NQZ68_019466 [Dissostichus eleginoides]
MISCRAQVTAERYTECVLRELEGEGEVRKLFDPEECFEAPGRKTGVSIGNEKQIPQTHQGDLKKLLRSFRLSNDSAERKTQSSYVRCARNNKSASSLNSSQLHGSQVSSSERARSHRGRDDAPHHRKNEAVSDDVCCGEPITVCDRPGTLYGFKEKRREKGKGRKNKKFLDWSLEN